MTHKFKNKVTENFHDFFYQKIKEKELDADLFWQNFNVGEQSKYSFFSAMRSGAKGVTTEQVEIAWEKYGVMPNFLFGLTNEISNYGSVVFEPGMVYGPELKKDLAQIRKLLDRLELKLSK